MQDMYNKNIVQQITLLLLFPNNFSGK